MLFRRRVLNYGLVCLFTVAVLCALVVKVPALLPWGSVVLSPASLDAMVTISTSPDKSMTFITCTPYHSPIWRRIVRSTLSCAFAIQYRLPVTNAIAHTGNAHVEFRGNLVRIAFADSSRFLFTIQPKGSTVPEQVEVDNLAGIITFGMAGLNSHDVFVASRDWTKRSCGL